MKSWENTLYKHDSYLQWIKFSQLVNMQETPSLSHGCTHTADWIEPTISENITTRVIIKKIVDGLDVESFDFYQVI